MMSCAVVMWGILGVLATTAGASAAERGDERKPDEQGFRITTPEGKTLIGEEDLVAYDFQRHVLMLKPGKRQALANRLRNRIVSGVPYEVRVDEEVIYRGHITSPLSSRSFNDHVLVLGALERPPHSNILSMELGYPSPDFFEQEDKRSDKRIRAALQKADLLKRIEPDECRARQ